MDINLSAPGLVCCAGNNKEEFFTNALCGNQEGIKPVSLGDAYFGDAVTSGGKRFLAGLVPETCLLFGDNFLPANVPSGRLFRMTLAALEQIREDVEAAVAAYGPDRVGVCAGSCDNGSEQSLPAHRAYFAQAHFPSAYELRFQSASLIAECIAAFFGIKGPCFTVATACASSAGAIVKGAQLIESGICDAVIAGGADLASETVLLGFAALEAVSDEICNPFSKNRKGITLGEGAAFYVMQRGTFVTKVPRCGLRKNGEPQTRQTNIKLLGYGESADAHHMTAPRPDGSGAQAAMKEALSMAGIAPADVGYINLHGTGTPLNDSMEALAIQTVFADNAPPLSSTKPITGHTLGAAGALELALCWMALTQGGLPAHCWDGETDEAIPPFNFVSQGEQQFANIKPQICMSNSFAFGGCNTSLIIGRKG